MLALRAHALELPSHLLGRVTCRTKAQACGPSLAAKSCLWAPLSCLSFFRSTSHTAGLVQPGRGELAWWAGNQGACRATYAVFCSRLHDVLWGGKLPLLLVTFSTRRAVDSKRVCRRPAIKQPSSLFVTPAPLPQAQLTMHSAYSHATHAHGMTHTHLTWYAYTLDVTQIHTHRHTWTHTHTRILVHTCWHTHIHRQCVSTSPACKNSPLPKQP